MDLFDIAAKITLNTSGFEKGLADAEGKGSSFASKLKSGLGSAVKFGGSVLLKATEVVGAGIAAGMTAAVDLARKATDAYADFEQLVGGVETLFKESAPIIREYADNAYKTAGLSANQYMETVTSFSASLLQSVGNDTVKAAEYADMAIRDMSDNANKMGTDMSSVQSAYQGFAKQNYTMLDNLKLGYGGTKEEMERLIRDAEALDSSFSVVHTKTKNGADEITYSYADIVEAIHIVQNEMGITGTTAKEASETISGSLSSAKAAWENLLVAFASGEDIDGAMDKLITSVTTFANNLIPVFSQALKGIGQAIRQLAPIIANELPGIISELLPVAMEVGMTLVESLIGAFEQLFPMLLELVTSHMSEILEMGMSLLSAVGQGIMEALPVLIDAATQIIFMIADTISKPENIESMVNGAVMIVTKLADSIAQLLPVLIPAAVSMILQLVESLIDNIDLLIDAAISMLEALAEGVVSAIPILIEKAPIIISKLFTAIVNSIPKLLDAGVRIINKLWEGIKTLWTAIKGWGGQIIDQVWSGLSNAINSAVSWGADLITNFWNGIKSKLSWLWDGVKGIAQGIANFLGFSEPKEGPLSNFHTFAPDMMELFMKGINDNKDKLTETVANAFDFRDAMTGPEYNGGFAFAGAGGYSGGMPTIDLLIDGKTLVGSTREHSDRSFGEMEKIRARWDGDQNEH